MIAAQAPRLLPKFQEAERCVWKVEDNPYIGKVDAICQGGCRDNCRGGSEEFIELFLLVRTFAVVARKLGTLGELVYIGDRPGKDDYFFAKGQTLEVLLNDLNLAFVGGLVGSQDSYLIGD
jgi:hypothetical protein